MRRLFPLFAAALAMSACTPAPEQPWLGYVEGEDAFISAPQPGWLVHLEVQRGEAVKKGQVLFTLDDTEQLAARDQTKAALAQARAQLAQIKAQLAYASKELLRQHHLAHASAGTGSALDAAQNNYNIAETQIEQMQAQERADEANLANAEYQLAQRKVVALTDGRVEDIYFRQGEYVPAAIPVISLLPPQNVYVRFFVPEKQFGRVHLGERVHIACDGCKQGIVAHISFIAQQEEFTPPVIFSIANRDKLVFKLEARAKGGLRLNPGQPVDVTPLD